jgi:hypothetical protein
MATESDLLTPKERLAISRRALVLQFEGRKPRHARAPAVEPLDDLEDIDELPLNEAQYESSGARFGWASMGRSVVRRWWRRHPANAVGQLARPLLDRYAREEPAKLVGAAAATGALIVLVKPWRLLSITAVLAAILKTSDVADLVTTMMQNNDYPRKDLS